MMRDFYFRIVTGRGRRSKEVVVRCKTIKWGRKEFTLQGEVSGLTITIRIERHTTRLFINFTPQFENRDIRDIRSILEFLYPLEETGKLEIFDLESQALIYTQNHSNMPSVDKCFSITPQLKEILNDALEIADYFDVKMAFPKYLSQQEVANLKIAVVIIREGKGTNIQLSMTLIKGQQYELRLMSALKAQNMQVRFHQHKGEELNIFGTKLNTKPLTFSSNSARCEKSDELMKQYHDATEGSTIPLTLVCDDGGFSFDNQDENSSLSITDEQGSLTLPVL